MPDGHWYLCADCRTENCKGTTPVRYIGSSEDWPDGPKLGGLSVPIPFELGCNTCGIVHDYRAADIKPYLLELEPFLGFENLL